MNIDVPRLVKWMLGDTVQMTKMATAEHNPCGTPNRQHDLVRARARRDVGSRRDGRRDMRKAGEEPTMIPDYLIIDEIRRRQEEAWEPEPLRIPLYIPQYPPPREKEEEPEDPKPAVIIIDMMAG